MLGHSLHITRALCQLMGCTFLTGLNRNILKSKHPTSDMWYTWSCLQSIRAVTMAPWPFSSSLSRDYSLPNSSWGSEMQRMYEHYNSMCEVEGDKIKGQWKRLASYKRFYAPGGPYISKLLLAKARFFSRNVEEQGAGFEYVAFENKQEKTCVCVFQAGHLLEGQLGYVHGGAIATIIDTVMGTLAICHFGFVMTANLTINYRSPIPLGSVVLVHSSLEEIKGRKIFISCQVTSSDGSKLHTEATALFIQSLGTTC